MKLYAITDASGMGLGQLREDQLGTLQPLANLNKSPITVTDPTTGTVHSIIKPATKRPGYSFERKQCIVRVHEDDKGVIQQFAKQLNDDRQKSL